MNILELIISVLSAVMDFFCSFFSPCYTAHETVDMLLLHMQALWIFSFIASKVVSISHPSPFSRVTGRCRHGTLTSWWHLWQYRRHISPLRWRERAVPQVTGPSAFCSSFTPISSGWWPRGRGREFERLKWGFFRMWVDSDFQTGCRSSDLRQPEAVTLLLPGVENTAVRRRPGRPCRSCYHQ